MNDIDYEGPSTSLQSSGASKTQSRADEPWSEVSAVGAVPSKSVPRAAAVPPVRLRRITWPAKGRVSISGAKNVVRLLWEPLAKSCGLSVCPCKIQNTHIHSQQTCEVFVWDFFFSKGVLQGAVRTCKAAHVVQDIQACSMPGRSHLINPCAYASLMTARLSGFFNTM